jgi:hypothetical protein
MPTLPYTIRPPKSWLEKAINDKLQEMEQKDISVYQTFLDFLNEPACQYGGCNAPFFVDYRHKNGEKIIELIKNKLVHSSNNFSSHSWQDAHYPITWAYPHHSKGKAGKGHAYWLGDNWSVCGRHNSTEPLNHIIKMSPHDPIDTDCKSCCRILEGWGFKPPYLPLNTPPIQIVED